MTSKEGWTRQHRLIDLKDKDLGDKKKTTMAFAGAVPEGYYKPTEQLWQDLHLETKQNYETNKNNDISEEH